MKKKMHDLCICIFTGGHPVDAFEMRILFKYSKAEKFLPLATAV